MRARNLKPATFKNELLAVADPIHTLIFQGLWCLADREGRLEDRPARIHLEVNPGRAFDITCRSLEWLADSGFIQRYEVQGKKLIQVVQFRKHQHPHHKEPPSTLPPPRFVVPFMGVKPESSPSDSGLLIPDSGLPLTYSGLRTPEAPEAKNGLSRNRKEELDRLVAEAARDIKTKEST